MTKILIFTFAAVDIALRVNVDSIKACMALPILPLVQVVVVQPIGIYQKLSLVIQVDTTIVIPLITEFQDCFCLS